MYLGARSMIGRVKVSIHGSGRCHHALTSSAAAELDFDVTPRLDEWQIEWPREGQVTRAYEIKLFESELTTWDDAPHGESQPIILERGTVACVQLLLVSPTDLVSEPEPFGRLARLAVKPDVGLEVLTMMTPQAPDEPARLFDGTEWATTHEHPTPLSKQSDVAYGFYEHTDYARGAFEFRPSMAFA